MRVKSIAKIIKIMNLVTQQNYTKKDSKNANALHTISGTTHLPRFTTFNILDLSLKYLQEPLCSPTGTECYQQLHVDSDDCLIPCKGLYADVQKDTSFESLDDIKVLKNTLDSCETYKRGFSEDIKYPKKISSK
jgi:hypothetical protein